MTSPFHAPIAEQIWDAKKADAAAAKDKENEL